jgi:23S rRNA G2069 N7-methylase RlmK/C1962 C5-methylase RlmI
LESLGEFRRLLAEASSQWEVRDESFNQRSLSEGQSRAQKYAAVGEFIARKSHVLILLWDGRDNQKVGGTAWVKKRREHWSKVAAQEGTAPDLFGYVGTIQVVTPRATADGRAQPRVEIVGDLPPAGPDQADERSKL